ncbi:MAG: polyhydroxyalkanoate depolymerase, partial [Xanthobacteraceae bacterium]
MLYQTFENYTLMTAPIRAGAAAALQALSMLPSGLPQSVVPRIAAALELISRSSLTYARPDYGIQPVRVGNRSYDVVEEVPFATAFGSLLHFRKVDAPE